jgi:4-hydroxy-tetrahydrodipicolinate synthase
MAQAARHLKLAGVFASAITPRNPNSQDPDISGSLDLLDFLAGAGVAGIALFGSTGEFLNYSFTERQRILYLGVKRSRVPLIAGVSHSTLAGAIQLADEAISSGADALLLMPPWFYPCSQLEIEEFYTRFAAETSDVIPILLHNTPHFTSKLEFETVRKLMDTGRFAGMKDSSGDCSFFERLVSLKRERPFALFNGSDRMTAQALRAGADGIISGSACAIPELMVGLGRSIASGDENQARALNDQLAEFVQWIERFPFPVGIKRAVELRGQKSAAPLTPLAPGTRQALEEFSAWFRTWLPQMRKAAAHA